MKMDNGYGHENESKYKLLEKIERFKLKAEEFLKNNVRAFIIDINNTYYFCDILFVGDTYLEIQNFKGLKKSEKSRLLWADVVKLEGYREKKDGME